MRKQDWAILFASVALGIWGLWLLLSSESIEEGRCRLVRKKADPSSELMGLAFQWLQPQAARPEQVRDLPAGFDRPAYYLLKAAGRRIPLVVNLSERPRLCVDADGDGSLGPERCFAATPVRRKRADSSPLQFGPLSLAGQEGSRAADGSFYVRGSCANPPAPLTTCPAFFRTGKLKLDGRTYRVAVVDGDCDGQYRSRISLPLDRNWRIPESDVFAIDLNGDGKFEFSFYGRSEVMPLGELVRVGDDYYSLEIASAGLSLALAKTEPQFGTLLMEPNDTTAELRLWSDAADQFLSGGRQWRLPAGKYKGVYAVVEKKDASGRVWSFSTDLTSAFSDLGPLNFFEIRPGETTRLRVGPPFVVKADVRPAGAGTVSISPVLIGCGGEHYQADWRRNWSRPVEHPFKIVDEKGNELVADKFQYG